MSPRLLWCVQPGWICIPLGLPMPLSDAARLALGRSSSVVPQCCQALPLFLKTWIGLCHAGAGLTVRLQDSFAMDAFLLLQLWLLFQ